MQSELLPRRSSELQYIADDGMTLPDKLTNRQQRRRQKSICLFEMKSLAALVSLALFCLSYLPFRVHGATFDRRATTDFVSTSGQKFALDGEDFVAAGTNAYWLAQCGDADIDTALTDIANAGLTVVRTW